MLQVKKALPKLQIFNARPVDKDTENKKGSIVDGTRDFSVDQNENDHIEAADDLDSGKMLVHINVNSKTPRKHIDNTKHKNSFLSKEVNNPILKNGNDYFIYYL